LALSPRLGGMQAVKIAAVAVCWRDNSLSTVGPGEGRLLKQTGFGVPAGRAAWHRTGHRGEMVCIWKLHFIEGRKHHSWCYLT